MLSSRVLAVARAGARGTTSDHAIAAATSGLLTLLVYTHAGYPLLARWLAGKQRPVNDRSSHALPSLTVVIPARNEADFIQAKLADTVAQDYPAELLEILVVDDASTDKTVALAEDFSQVRVLRQAMWLGKAAALNRGVANAQGEIVVFTDANGSLIAGSLRAIVGPFADPAVAVVGGEKRPVGGGAHGKGESMYWALESGLKKAEGKLGSVVGADGGIYAVRASTYVPLPAGIYADDYWIPLDALSRGRDVRHISEAAAVEAVSRSKRDDFERRTRIAAGIWHGSWAHRGLAHPRRGFKSVAFISHRVLRSIVVPTSLPVLAVLPLFRLEARWARLLLGTQLLCWGAAALGAVTDASGLGAPYQFAATNAAAVRGGVRQVLRRQSPQWMRTARGAWA